MAECTVPYVPPGSLENLMHQFFPSTTGGLVKKEIEEVPEDTMEYGTAAHHGYSPENEHAATSSERDESPDTLSHHSSENNPVDDANTVQRPTALSGGGLQHQLLMLQSSLQSKMKDEPLSLDSHKPGSKIDGLADRLVASASSPPRSSSAFQPLAPALSALAMQLAASNPSLSFHPPPLHSSPSPLQSALAGLPAPVAQRPLVPPGGTNSAGFAQSPKRKRQRRNPVWPYFIVEEGVARCKQCAYSTRSVFSTNLKVHLRSHHRSDYEKVIEAEDQLNLNALLLSGNAANGLMGKDSRKRPGLPPMTSSILMTISKLAAAGQAPVLQAALAAATPPPGGAPALPPTPVQPSSPAPLSSTDSDPMAVLRQTLAANQLQKMGGNGGDFINFQAMANLALARQHLQAQLAASARSSPAPPPVSTPPSAPREAPSTPLSTSAEDNKFGLLGHFGGGSPLSASLFGSEMPQPKRRRLRRHPVWMFFRDLEDRMVGCINCSFRTGSAFSTNLKMHLKAHHKEDYAKVLKLEDEMRIEEGIFGAPNKIKSELIDFIRGGGNASTPMAVNHGTSPTPSPLVQQLIAGNFSSGRSSPQNTPAKSINNNASPPKGSEEEFSSLSMTDRLAALVGLSATAPVEEDNNHEGNTNNGDLLARLGLLAQAQQPPSQSLSISALSAFTGSSSAASNGNSSDSKSCTSSSVDGSTFDDRKSERDRAVAKFVTAVGPDVVQSDHFKDLLRALVPEYEVPCMVALSALVSPASPPEEEEEEGEEEGREASYDEAPHHSSIHDILQSLKAAQ